MKKVLSMMFLISMTNFCWSQDHENLFRHNDSRKIPLQQDLPSFNSKKELKEKLLKSYEQFENHKNSSIERKNSFINKLIHASIRINS